MSVIILLPPSGTVSEQRAAYVWDASKRGLDLARAGDFANAIFFQGVLLNYAKHHSASPLGRLCRSSARTIDLIINGTVRHGGYG